MSSFGQSLRELADSREILLGTAVRPALFLEAPYSGTLASEFNMLEPERKEVVGHPFPPVDIRLYASGPGCGLRRSSQHESPRSHVGLGMVQPALAHEPRFTPEQLSQLLREHITRVVTH